MIRAILLPLVLVGAPAIAAHKAPAVDPHLKAEFAASDTDHNGVLSRAEVRARVAGMSSGANKLTDAQVTTLASRLFALADRDHSGGVTPAEMQAAFRATARRYDTNGDGVISIAERKAARAAVKAAADGR